MQDVNISLRRGSLTQETVSVEVPNAEIKVKLKAGREYKKGQEMIYYELQYPATLPYSPAHSVLACPGRRPLSPRPPLGLLPLGLRGNVAKRPTDTIIPRYRTRRLETQGAFLGQKVIAISRIRLYKSNSVDGYGSGSGGGAAT